MKGIDVSKHQGDIDWDKVKNEIDFAIIRISYGQKTVDPKAIRNIEECIRLGIPFGVYTYSYALNVEQAVIEANLVINTLAPYKNKIQFPVFIDMEDADKYKEKHGFPSNDTLVAICEKECLMFEESGYYAAIYASKSWFDTKLKSSRLDRFDKWIAWWNNSAKINTSLYGMWQYTSSGKVNGINGNVDMNEAFRNYPSMINPTTTSIEPQPQPQPEPTPEPVKSTEQLAQEVIEGKYGVGNERKQALGDRYDEVQARVNEIMKQNSNKLSVGDTVTIVAPGNGASDGSGRPAMGIGWVRTIMAIKDTASYPYKVGTNGAVTGWYKADALRK